MSVDIKDRKEEIEWLRMALNMCEININYTHADLIIKVVKDLDKLKGKFTIYDGVEIHYKWKEKWDNYYKNKKDGTIESEQTRKIIEQAKEIQELNKRVDASML